MAQEYPTPEHDARRRAKLRREIRKEFRTFWDRLLADSMARLRAISPEEWEAARKADEGEPIA